MPNLHPHVKRWWDAANKRRRRLIDLKHDKSGYSKLTPIQEAEFEMLQNVAEAIVDYVDKVPCKLCGQILENRDFGWFRTHVCKKARRKPNAK